MITKRRYCYTPYAIKKCFHEIPLSNDGAAFSFLHRSNVICICTLKEQNSDFVDFVLAIHMVSHNYKKNFLCKVNIFFSLEFKRELANTHFKTFLGSFECKRGDAPFRSQIMRKRKFTLISSTSYF